MRTRQRFVVRMRIRPPRLLFWTVAFFLFPLAAWSWAEGPPAAAETPSLEKAVDDLQKGADSIANKAKELMAVIASEASAKRITEPVAQGLRWGLRNLTAPGAQDRLLSTVAMPENDEAIMNAAHAYQETANKVRAEAAGLSERAEFAAVKRCSALVGDAKTAADVEPVQALLGRLQALAPGWRTNNLSTLMLHLQECLDLTSTSDPAAVDAVLSSLNPRQNGAINLRGEASFDQRAALVLAPFKKASEEAQNDLESALGIRKSSERIYTALAAFEDAFNRLNRASIFKGGANEVPSTMDSYQTLASIAGAIESHRWRSARSAMDARRQPNSDLQRLAGRRPAIHALIEKWTTEIADSEALEARQFHEQLRAKFAAVKQPADLGPIITELAKYQQNAETDRFDRFSESPSMRLSALAAAWKDDDLHGLANQISRQSRPEEAAWSEDLAGVRDRAERDILSRVLKAPELLQAPFLNQSVSDAVAGLLGQLTAGGEWRRALQILESQSALDPEPGASPRRSEAITAQRSYLAGQNFERAELWTDAAAAYKTVLTATVDGIPIKEATERLRALTKEHPEEVKAARALPMPESSQIIRQ